MYLNTPSIFRNIPPVTLNLLILNVLIFIVMALSPAVDFTLTKRLSLFYFTSPNFAPWQLITYMFLHGSFGHLFFNMFALLMFGSTIERCMGSARFLFYYITCGIFAALVQMGVFAFMIHNLEAIINDSELSAYAQSLGFPPPGGVYLPPEAISLYHYVNTPMLGASGAVYGVLLAFGFLFPNAPIYLFFIPIPIKAKWLIIGYFVLELVYGVSDTASGVAHFAHLGGMIFGFLMLLYWKKKGVFSNRWFF